MVIPRNSYELGPFAQHAVAVLEEFPDEYHAGHRTDRMKTALENYAQKLAAHETARDAAKAATNAKNAASEELLSAIQSTFRFVKGNDEVSDAALERLGVTPRTTHRTPVQPPTDFPVGAVISSDLLKHTITIFDPSRRTHKGKPHGVTGCEVYVAIGNDAPTDPAAYRLATIATRDSAQVSFPAEEGGQQAHYLLRWVNSRGEFGPWSPTFGGTVPAL